MKNRWWIALSLVAAFAFQGAAFAANKDINALLDVTYDRNQGDHGTPVVKVYLNGKTARQMDRNEVIEVRIYSGEQKGQEKRIERKNGDPYILNGKSGSYTYPPAAACPRPGNYFGKIWLDVKAKNGDKLQDQKDWDSKELRFEYTCYNRDARDLDIEKASIELAQKDPRTGHYHQVNFVYAIAERDFSTLSQGNGGALIKFFVYRDGQKIPVAKEEGYKASNRKGSYTLPIADLCGKARTWWEEDDRGWLNQSKEIEISYEITPLFRDGNPSYSFYKVIADKGDRKQVTCVYN